MLEGFFEDLVCMCFWGIMTTFSNSLIMNTTRHGLLMLMVQNTHRSCSCLVNSIRTCLSFPTCVVAGAVKCSRVWWQTYKNADSLSLSGISLAFTHVYFDWYSYFKTFIGILLASFPGHRCPGSMVNGLNWRYSGSGAHWHFIGTRGSLRLSLPNVSFLTVQSVVFLGGLWRLNSWS